jgi:hypothetical protein
LDLSKFSLIRLRGEPYWCIRSLVKMGVVHELRPRALNRSRHTERSTDKRHAIDPGILAVLRGIALRYPKGYERDFPSIGAVAIINVSN